MPGSRNSRPDPRRGAGDHYNYSGRRPEGRGKNRNNLGKAFAISLCIVLGIVIISGGVIYKFGHDMYSNLNYVADEEVKIEETLPEAAEAETLSPEERVGVVVNADELQSIHDMMGGLSGMEVKKDDEIYNVLMVGVDRQDRTWNGNSDCMILVSINKAKNKVNMVSLMRDTYVDIAGVGYDKLNSSYAYGGGPLLCSTVTDAFKIQVDRYVAVDFFDLVDIIDYIGGVTLEVSDEEAEVANGYIQDMCGRLMNIDPEPHLFPGGGTFYCDGVQAVAFARNRFVGNSDFARTERQRYVINQLIKEVRNMSLAQMTEKMQGVLKYVTMNIPESEIWDMVKEVPEILDYQFETSRVPYDNMYKIISVNSQDMLVPDWEETLAKLQEEIYG